MKATPTPIPGAYVIEPTVHRDARGFFMEAYNREAFHRLGIMDEFVQDNLSRSAKGVLRGMHLQVAPRQMSKLVRCATGRLFDVIVDLRRDAPTLGKWFGLELDADTHRMLYVPAGCAHGFYALEDCELFYKCAGSTYSPEHERGFAWDDPTVAIDWPLDDAPILSPRDRAQPAFSALD